MTPSNLAYFSEELMQQMINEDGQVHRLAMEDVVHGMQGMHRGMQGGHGFVQGGEQGDGQDHERSGGHGGEQGGEQSGVQGGCGFPWFICEPTQMMNTCDFRRLYSLTGFHFFSPLLDCCLVSQ
jgi:hypothetical protein